jgi:hypothetical protein
MVHPNTNHHTYPNKNADENPNANQDKDTHANRYAPTCCRQWKWRPQQQRRQLRWNNPHPAHEPDSDPNSVHQWR